MYLETSTEQGPSEARGEDGNRRDGLNDSLARDIEDGGGLLDIEGEETTGNTVDIWLEKLDTELAASEVDEGGEGNERNETLALM